MKEVTHEEFFIALGNQNVHPTIINSYEHGGRGYIAMWKHQVSRQVLGKTESGDFPHTQKRFFLNNG